MSGQFRATNGTNPGTPQQASPIGNFIQQQQNQGFQQQQQQQQQYNQMTPNKSFGPQQPTNYQQNLGYQQPYSQSYYPNTASGQGQQQPYQSNSDFPQQSMNFQQYTSYSQNTTFQQPQQQPYYPTIAASQQQQYYQPIYSFVQNKQQAQPPQQQPQADSNNPQKPPTPPAPTANRLPAIQTSTKSQQSQTGQTKMPPSVSPVQNQSKQQQTLSPPQQQRQPTQFLGQNQTYQQPQAQNQFHQSTPPKVQQKTQSPPQPKVGAQPQTNQPQPHHTFSPPPPITSQNQQFGAQSQTYQQTQQTQNQQFGSRPYQTQPQFYQGIPPPQTQQRMPTPSQSQFGTQPQIYQQQGQPQPYPTFPPPPPMTSQNQFGTQPQTYKQQPQPMQKQQFGTQSQTNHQQGQPQPHHTFSPPPPMTPQNQFGTQSQTYKQQPQPMQNQQFGSRPYQTQPQFYQGIPPPQTQQRMPTPSQSQFGAQPQTYQQQGQPQPYPTFPPPPPITSQNQFGTQPQTYKQQPQPMQNQQFGTQSQIYQQQQPMQKQQFGAGLSTLPPQAQHTFPPPSPMTSQNQFGTQSQIYQQQPQPMQKQQFGAGLSTLPPQAPTQKTFTDKSWEQSKLMNIQQKDIDALSQYSWSPTTWSSCYKSFENDPKKRAVLVALASKYTVNYIRDGKSIMQAKPFSDEQMVRVMRTYKPKSAKAYMTTQDIRYRNPVENLSEMTFQKTVTATGGGTDVYIVNADVLDISEQLLRKTTPPKKTLAVNACDLRSHGGKWLTGGCGQEENFMIRSELCAVLGEFYYPLHERMLILANNVGVVRGSLDAGYPFLDPESSMWRVDVASIPNCGAPSTAAIGEQIYSLQTRLEMVLRAALEFGYKVVVLPIFMGMTGPKDAAVVVGGVLRAFAGCFERIYIGGSDAYYTRDIVASYAQVLTPDVKPDAWYNKVRDIQQYSPHVYPVPDTAKHYACLDINAQPCRHWEKCTNIFNDHRATFVHPQPCPDGKSCTSNDPTHLAMYVHANRCKDGATCPIAVAVASNTADPGDAETANHMKTFSHPKACDRWSSCQVTDPAHVAEYLHPPVCPEGPNCPERSNPQHAAKFRHILQVCPHGTRCPRYADPAHLAAAIHPFKTPCPNGPRCNRKDSDKYAHICPKGPECPMIGDEAHVKDWIHVGKECKYGAKCGDISEEHLGAYYHSSLNGAPTRHMCQIKWCSDYSGDHRRNLEHYPFWLAPSPVLMLNVVDPIPDAKGVKEAFCFKIIENGKHWSEKIDAYTKNQMPDETSENFRQIKIWFETMQPNHMCSAKTFLSIANLGNYTSLALLKDFWVKKNDLIEAVMQGPYTKALFIRYGINTTDEDAMNMVRKYGRKFIRVRQGEISHDKISLYQNKPNALSALNTTKPVAASKRNSWMETRAALVTSISEEFVDAFDAHINKILDDVLTLIADPPGIGNTKNIEVRTNYTIFTIVGPHYGNYDNAEVVMVLKKEIMHHPDFYMCPGSVLNYQDGDFTKGRPWVRNMKKSHRGYYEELDHEKVAGFTPDWSTAATKEWIARVHETTGKAYKDVTLVDVMKNWAELGPWATIEGHLPYRVPIEYTDHVIFSQKAYDEVVADNTGRIILSEWERMYGKDFIKKVPGPDDVRIETALYHATQKIPPVGVPKGMCFCLEKTPYEKVLPMYLSTSDHANFWITFTAKGPFYFTLSTDCITTNSSRKLLTIKVQSTEASAYYRVPSVCIPSEMQALCPGFNAMLSQDSFIQYAIEVNYKTSQVVVTHWGPASAVNSAKFVIPLKGGIKYKYIAFACPEGALSCPIIWDLRHMNKAPACILEPVDSRKNVGSAVNPQPDASGFPQKPGAPPPQPALPQVSSALPDCGNPFDCVKANNRREVDHSSHIRQYSHVCRFGRNCRSLNDPAHLSMFHHMAKDPCPDGAKCTKLTDPAHRFQFEHKPLADFLMPCMHGTGCEDINDVGHCKDYFHGGFSFPPLSSVKLIN